MKINNLTPDTTALQELGTRLARIRKQRGYSQQRLADDAGIGVATLRRIEDGRDSQLGSWIKLLKALQMSSAIDSLLPESFQSPMAEVKAQGKKRRNQVEEPSTSPWQDEQQ
ncbi:helix-turn-helix transcriptional regulator [Porticoccus sp. W117]|uniref:helix-turn-helix domain-containing protein n=1 Tax=Porticoccus sp. W117 TaxID=3054777 RepID=UPI002592FB4F|nr:helix-turn-helix transcriptional regulator [Porticoccus sp. W117]MDM3870011.1 helix-turn-helix transcriptional regulator [Porticoccus sp. W117]